MRPILPKLWQAVQPRPSLRPVQGGLTVAVPTTSREPEQALQLLAFLGALVAASGTAVRVHLPVPVPASVRRLQ